jgi:hypothetical protein
VSGGLAALSIRPQAYSGLHQDEISSFVKPSYLKQEPTQVAGTLLDGSVKAVIAARRVNHKKAKRLGCAFRVFLAALLVTAAAGVTLAVEGATHERRESNTPGRGAGDTGPTSGRPAWAGRGPSVSSAPDGARSKRLGRL